MEFDFDLFVIGGGSGGVRAARIASGEAGAKVALAEDDRMGGTCVIRGCVPKKLMVFASGYRDQIEDARGYGWEVSGEKFHWPVMRDRLQNGLDQLEAVYRDMLDKSGVTTYNARARLADAHTVELSTGERVTARHMLVATGARPMLPDVKGGEYAIVSDDIFGLDEIPGRVLVVGGGYIACEFACILHGMGANVCQFYRGAQILRGFDDEARGLVAEEMRHRGIDIHTGTNVLSITPSGDAYRVKASDGTETDFDQVLFAIGRTPNTADMGLEEIGIEIGRRGEIVVDEYSQTGVPSIYAIGDVTHRVNLTPVAIREGMNFVETVFKGNPTPVDHDLIPSAIFTQPEMGTIGMTEEAARDAGPIEVYCTSFRPMQTAFAERPDRVLMKLIVDTDSRKVLGCHIVAPQAAELIQMVGIAIKLGATKEDFDQTVAVHPTMSEELVTMRTPVRRA